MGMPQESQFELGRLHNGDLILDNEYVTLWYYPELKIVHHRMHQMPDSTAFRELLSAGANVVERHRAPKWLSDDRNNTLLREQDEEWADQEWLPRVVNGGFKYWAIVLPTAAIGKLNMRRLAAQHAAHGITSAVLGTPEAAFSWLKAQ